MLKSSLGLLCAASGAQIPVTVTPIFATPPNTGAKTRLLSSLEKYPYVPFAGQTSLYSYSDDDDDGDENDGNKEVRLFEKIPSTIISYTVFPTPGAQYYCHHLKDEERGAQKS